MRWVTLSHVHLDRVAVPWLVRRFVDSDATFEFVEWGSDDLLPTAGSVEMPQGAIPFGIPGVEFAMHDDAGSCFSKVMRAYNIHDPALWRLERLIASGISHHNNDTPPPDQTEDERTLGAALLLIGTGFGLTFDDEEHLQQSASLYDSLYMYCRLLELPNDVIQQAPQLPPGRVPYLRNALEGVVK